MLTPATGSPTESLKDRDSRFGAAMRAIINDPAVIVGKDADSIKALIGFCGRRLGRMRMGGRSVPLVGLSVVLWNAQDLLELDLDLEDLLTTALAIAMDPSYIWPEWGIVLAGVLICRHLSERPEDSGQPKRDEKELINQCRLRLRHLIESHLPRPSEPVRNASRVLDDQWTLGFPNGLQPVVDSCLDSWPSTREVTSVSPEFLQQKIDALDQIQPAWYSEEDRRFYRLSMERAGTWIVSSVVLRRS
jgi:hypothetical protein